MTTGERDSSTQSPLTAHRLLLTAVLAGDLPLARDQLRIHLRSVFGDIEKIRQRSPELFAGSDSVPVRRSVAVWQ